VLSVIGQCAARAAAFQPNCEALRSPAKAEILPFKTIQADLTNTFDRHFLM
jgi:hypothetical protein